MHFICPLIIAIQMVAVGVKLDVPGAYIIAFGFLVISVVMFVLERVCAKGDEF